MIAGEERSTALLQKGPSFDENNKDSLDRICDVR